MLGARLVRVPAMDRRKFLAAASSAAALNFNCESARVVKEIGDGVSSPRLIHKVEPTYSKQARQAKLEGVVMLAVEVWEDGLPHNIRVVRSLGLGLDENAVEAVKQWRFSPGMEDGTPVRVQAQVEIKFRLI